MLGKESAVPFTAAEALERFESVVRLAPADPELRLGLSRALLALGRKEAALDETRAAYALRPALWETRRHLAIALFENGRHDEAAFQFRRLAEEDRKNASLRHALILCLHRAGALDEAGREAPEARRLFPDDPLFDLWGARLAARRGRLDEALGHLEEGRRKKAPVDAWLREIPDLRPLRRDPRAGEPSETPRR